METKRPGRWFTGEAPSGPEHWTILTDGWSSILVTLGPLDIAWEASPNIKIMEANNIQIKYQKPLLPSRLVLECKFCFHSLIPFSYSPNLLCKNKKQEMIFHVNLCLDSDQWPQNTVVGLKMHHAPQALTKFPDLGLMMETKYIIHPTGHQPSWVHSGCSLLCFAPAGSPLTPSIVHIHFCHSCFLLWNSPCLPDTVLYFDWCFLFFVCIVQLSRILKSPVISLFFPPCLGDTVEVRSKPLSTDCTPCMRHWTLRTQRWWKCSPISVDMEHGERWAISKKQI